MGDVSATVFSRAQIVAALVYWERRHPTVDYCLSKQVSKLADVLATMDFRGEVLVDLGFDDQRKALVCDALGLRSLL